MTRGHRPNVIACVLSLAAACAIARQPSLAPPDVDSARDAVAGLASESWTDREAASAALRQLARTLDADTGLYTLESALADWMADRGASQDGEGDRAEVLARYELEAIWAFFNAPRAGLGITYDPAPPSRGVRLGATVEDFDAHGKLRSGDIVLRLSGAPIEMVIDLPVAIASHLPGEETIISVLRDGEPMEIAVTLGYRQDLNQVRPLEEPILRRAWAIRMNRLRGDGTHDKLNTDLPRSIVAAPVARSRTRMRPLVADVAVGGQPGQSVAQHVGVVAQMPRVNGAEAIIQAELSQIKGTLDRVARDLQTIRAEARKLIAEIPMTADTMEGRAHAGRLRARIAELRQQQEVLEKRQIELIQDRTRLIRELSQ